MFEVRKWIEIDAGHRVPFHNSKCRNLHGHRYRITAVVQAEELIPPESKRSDSGMVVDFGVIKELLMEIVHDPFDHKFLLWVNDPWLSFLHRSEAWDGIKLLPCIPTAEELAKFWAGLLAPRLAAELTEEFHHLSLKSLEVRETPTSTAIFYLEDSNGPE